MGLLTHLGRCDESPNSIGQQLDDKISRLIQRVSDMKPPRNMNRDQQSLVDLLRECTKRIKHLESELTETGKVVHILIDRIAAVEGDLAAVEVANAEMVRQIADLQRRIMPLTGGE